LFTAAAPAQANSSIQTNLAAYTAGDEMLVTVTLKDAYGNTVSGQNNSLTDTTVTVENASAKVNSSWNDNEDGT
ncbi:hypothetical protein, partial [Providencia rettgeri]